MKLTWTRPLLLALLTLIIVACGGKDDNNDIPDDVKSEDALKVQVEETGVYQIPLSQLRSAGLNVETLSAENVALSHAGEALPYAIVDEALVFYGEAADSRYNRYNPYIIRVGETGQLMGEQTVTNSASDTVSTVSQQVLIEENLLYEQRAAETQEGGEVWFWQKIVHNGADATIELTVDLPSVAAGCDTSPCSTAEIKLHLWGLTYANDIENDHDFDLIINGETVDTVQFDGQIYFESSSVVDGDILVEGENTIVLDNSGEGAARIDHFYLDWIALDYQAPLTAIDDRLLVADAVGNVEIGGFSAEPVLINTTDPLAPTVLTDWAYDADTVSFDLDEGESVAVIGPDGYLSPAAIEPLIATTLRDTTNQAELLIVTTRELASGLDELIAAREAQGLGVVLATVDELYDEFGYGDVGPDAIRHFATYAVENWTEPKPRYLFFVGDATTDMLGYEANNPDNPVEPPRNIVPSQIVEVSFSGETVSDARMADVDGDLKPDLAVGRWPVDDVRTVRELVQRQLAYEAGVSAENAIFTFDASDGSTEFSRFTDRLIEDSAFPEQHALRVAGAETEEESTTVASELADGWNDGAWLVSYVGHGSLELWGKHEVFSVDSVGQLGAGEASPPIVLQFSCLTGQFAHPSIESISETMLKHDNGPMLLVAATSLTLSTNQSPFAIALMSELQNPEQTRIGDALQVAKNGLDIESNRGLQEISDTFGLIGDPSSLIIRPAELLPTQ